MDEIMTMQEKMDFLVERIEKYTRDFQVGKPPIDDFPIRYFLLVPKYSVNVDVSYFVPNWKIIETTIGRSDLSGAYLELSGDIELVKEAKDIMELLFIEYGLYAEADFQVWTRAIDMRRYSLTKEVKIDFSTYKHDDLRVYIGGKVSTLREYIRAHGSMKQDITVSEVKEKKTWMYDRLQMTNTATYTMPSESEKGLIIANLHRIHVPLPLYFNNVEKIPDVTAPEFENVKLDYKDAQPFLIGTDKKKIKVEINTRIGIKTAIEKIAEDRIKIILYQERQGEVIASNPYGNYTKDDEGYFWFEIWSQSTFDIKDGDELKFVCELDMQGNAPGVIYTKSEQEGEFKVSWDEKGKPLEIDVIKPETLLQKLVDGISDDKKFITGIEWETEEEENILICAAESIRKMDEAKFHGSYNDFKEWMEVRGYEYSFEDDKVIFKHRDRYFQKGVVGMELEDRAVKKLEVEADPEYAYTSIQVGYKKQNYNVVSGKLEVMGTFEYKTGYINYIPEVLKIISPYRADSMGIELLCWEYLKNTKDTQSDNDVFMVALEEREDEYKVSLVESINSGGTKLFNGILTPEKLLMMNESKIGIISKEVEFMSTESYRFATKEGGNLYQKRIPITKKLFEPKGYYIYVDTFLAIPPHDKMNAEIRFTYQYRRYRGYVNNIHKPYGAQDPSEWTLRVIED